MYVRTRTLITAVLAAVMTIGMSAGVLAQSVPQDSSATTVITLQVHESANNLWVGVTAGPFETVQAGSASSGPLDMAVVDDRPADQTEWYVSAQMTEFTTADGQNSFLPVEDAVVWSNVTTTGGSVASISPISPIPNTVWENVTDTDTKVASATAKGTGKFTVPDDTATGNYSSTITVTITGTDPGA